MKQAWKRIGGLFLSVCMVVTLLPTMAFAETQDSAVPLGMSGKISAFADLDADIAAQTVEAGTAEDELNLPNELAVTIVTDSAVTATDSDAQKETVETIITVSGWTSDTEYDGDATGFYSFSPAPDLWSGVTLADGVILPTITVTVVETTTPQVLGDTSPMAVTVNDPAGLKLALEKDTPDIINVAADITLTEAVTLGASHMLIIQNGKFLTVDDILNGQATLTVPDGKTLILSGGGTLEVSNSTTSFGVLVMGSMTVSGGRLTVKNSGEYTEGICAFGLLSIENSSILSVQNTETNKGISGNVTILDSTATISNTNTKTTECSGIFPDTLTIDNSTVIISNSSNSVGILVRNFHASILLKNNAHVIMAGQETGIYFGINSGSLTVDGSTLELQ